MSINTLQAISNYLTKHGIKNQINTNLFGTAIYLSQSDTTTWSVNICFHKRDSVIIYKKASFQYIILEIVDPEFFPKILKYIKYKYAPGDI